MTNLTMTIFCSTVGVKHKGLERDMLSERGILVKLHKMDISKIAAESTYSMQ